MSLKVSFIKTIIKILSKPSSRLIKPFIEGYNITLYEIVHLLCFICNAVKNRPVDEFQNFEGVV